MLLTMLRGLFNRASAAAKRMQMHSDIIEEKLIMTEITTSEVLPPMPQKNRVHLPLNDENRSSLETSGAAYHLNRAEQTLRFWACSQSGPIRPLRINGRLHWLVSDIRKLLGEE